MFRPDTILGDMLSGDMVLGPRYVLRFQFLSSSPKLVQEDISSGDGLQELGHAPLHFRETFRRRHRVVPRCIFGVSFG